MPLNWDKLNKETEPDPEAIEAYVNNPLWKECCNYLEAAHGGKSICEFSRCSVPGWNVKYKKSGRSLSTLYPMEGYFIALVVLTERMWTPMEQLLPCMTPYLQRLYKEAKAGMGQKWLMIEVRDTAVFKDFKQCLAIRMGNLK